MPKPINIRHKHICFSDAMRTTVELQDNIYERIVRDAGKRRISETINAILASHYRKKKSKFGADPWLRKARRDDLRDEYDRDI
jgi:hypothetical protein